MINGTLDEPDEISLEQCVCALGKLYDATKEPGAARCQHHAVVAGLLHCSHYRRYSATVDPGYT